MLHHFSFFLFLFHIFQAKHMKSIFWPVFGCAAPKNWSKYTTNDLYCFTQLQFLPSMCPYYEPSKNWPIRSSYREVLFVILLWWKVQGNEQDLKRAWFCSPFMLDNMWLRIIISLFNYISTCCQTKKWRQLRVTLINKFVAIELTRIIVY